MSRLSERNVTFRTYWNKKLAEEKNNKVQHIKVVKDDRIRSP